jgi:acyl-CoA dehydrogenase
MAFFQDPPVLGNQWQDDPLLRELCERLWPRELFARLAPELDALGELGGDELLRAQIDDRLNEPTLVQWDAWGKRVDRIEVSPLWRRAQELSAREGLVAIAHERREGRWSRMHQFVRNYLVQQSLDVYSCPLAMTDGAAATLTEYAAPALRDRALPRLMSRDPAVMWTSGQWMTERTGGSDVGLSETVARKGDDGRWRLYGTKFFTSATTAEMALTLGRPEGGAAGGKGLAIFYVETRQADGRLQPGMTVNRLKDKLGTRKVPTAELTLDGVLAEPVRGTADGIKHMVPMLNVTRLWNAMGSAWSLRRSVALAVDYARRRVQFGARLIEKPLHVDTLAGIVAEHHGAALLAFFTAELRGACEAGEATDAERLLARVVTPLAKLTTAKQAVAGASESLEAFGGAGYMEDTGLPVMLRDAQVMPIWEGTTNVLSLDTLRALAQEGAHAILTETILARAARATSVELAEPVATVHAALARVQAWLASVMPRPPLVEAGARGLALTLGRTLELALLCEHAQWCLDHGKGPRAAAAARRLAQAGVDCLAPIRDADSAILVS